MKDVNELKLYLEDKEWEYTYTDHDREIVRAIVVDDDGYFYFARLDRDDIFEPCVVIETSGGGVEKGEDLQEAIKRELLEELGAKVEIIDKIGVVSDYYNLIGRHNINHYFLCKALSFGKNHLTEDEVNAFHLTTLKLKYEDAVAYYQKNLTSKLGRLIFNREMPILKRAKEMLGIVTEDDELAEYRYRPFYVKNSRVRGIEVAVSLVYRGDFNDSRLIDSTHYNLDLLKGRELHFFNAYLNNSPCYSVAPLKVENDVLYLVDENGVEHESNLYSITFTADYDEKYIIASTISLTTKE